VEDWGFWTKVRWRKLGVSWRNTAELAEQHAEELEREISKMDSTAEDEELMAWIVGSPLAVAA
jgi:hypothetical protein